MRISLRGIDSCLRGEQGSGHEQSEAVLDFRQESSVWMKGPVRALDIGGT